MSKVHLIVSIDGDQPEMLDEVAERLTEAGMKVRERLHEIGVITGSADAEKVKDLSQVQGVTNIEPSRKVSKA
ncbi:MAG TPA: hypothetical protein VGX24_17950 [Pyrinomonadaceae bacterium]|jgi:DNA-binding ferritin-like protein|nr:hypothetical protein [Pyrinomonadaceae bacterium]